MGLGKYLLKEGEGGYQNSFVCGLFFKSPCHSTLRGQET